MWWSLNSSKGSIHSSFGPWDFSTIPNLGMRLMPVHPDTHMHGLAYHSTLWAPVKLWIEQRSQNWPRLGIRDVSRDTTAKSCLVSATATWGTRQKHLSQLVNSYLGTWCEFNVEKIHIIECPGLFLSLVPMAENPLCVYVHKMDSVTTGTSGY